MAHFVCGFSPLDHLTESLGHSFLGLENSAAVGRHSLRQTKKMI